ncbi:hypothetical protein ES703_90650 [subsurface metagenome]
MEEMEIMTVKQVAKYLQMDEHTIYKLAYSGSYSSASIFDLNVLYFPSLKS